MFRQQAAPQTSKQFGADVCTRDTLLESDKLGLNAISCLYSMIAKDQMCIKLTSHKKKIACLNTAHITYNKVY